MKRKEVTTELGKINFAYQEGDPLIVYLNGFGSFDTAQSFQKVIESLPNNYGVFAPDYLNSGFSGISLRNYTITDEAIQLAKIINHLKAKKVIILAHSIGGVYAMQMKDTVNNLKAFISIEPTTREIILNPPKESAYSENSKTMDEIEKKIKSDLARILTPEEDKDFWSITEKNVEKFDEKDNQNAQSCLENDLFWKSDKKLDDDIPSIIITEEYREEEYKHSEYHTDNPKSKVVTLGDYHYIHFEYPKKIADIVKKADKSI